MKYFPIAQIANFRPQFSSFKRDKEAKKNELIRKF